MYIFYPVNNNKANVDLAVTRAIYVVAAAGAFARYADYGWVALLVTIFLIVISIYVNAIKAILKLPVVMMLVIAISFLCIVTQTPYFALVLLLHWVLVKFLSKEPKYQIDEFGIKITNLFTEKIFSWAAVQNVIFKDGLLTVDFKNNRIFQHAVLSKDIDLDENTFNQFCTQKLLGINAQHKVL